MTRKPRMGRPPKPKGEARGSLLSLRLTPVERAAIDLAAELAGQSASEWARILLIAAAKRA